MKFNIILSIITILILCSGSFSMAQEDDSIRTSFRKGRWLTGLSGTISSTVTTFGNNPVKTTANNYGIGVKNGRFFHNRWLIGGIFQANRSSTSGDAKKSAETFYIGPFINFYLMDGKTGSLFASVSLGYLRYLDETQVITEDQIVEVVSEGGGLGSILSLGYSYTLNDFVAFDLGINLNLFWANLKQKSLPSQTVTKTSITANQLSFAFGFSVILDNFFF